MTVVVMITIMMIMEISKSPQFVFYSSCLASSSAVLMEGCRNNFWLTPSPPPRLSMFVPYNSHVTSICKHSNPAIWWGFTLGNFTNLKNDALSCEVDRFSLPWSKVDWKTVESSILSNFWQTRRSSVKTQATSPGLSWTWWCYVTIISLTNQL